MTLEERLTAYALNDPSLTAADRGEIEAMLEADPAARQTVAETRKVAEMLTAGLHAEQAATPASEFVTVPAPTAKPRSGRWTRYVVAATVLLALTGGLGTFLATQTWTKGQYSSPAISDSPRAMHRERILADDTRDLASASLGEKDTSELQKDSAKNPAEPDHPLAPSEEPGRPRTRLSTRGVGLPTDSSPAPSAGTSPVPAKPAAPTPTPGLVSPLAEDRLRLAHPDPEVTRLYVVPDPKPAPDTLAALKDRKNSEGEAKGDGGAAPDGEGRERYRQATADRYPALRENAFVTVAGQHALSTFGIDVDTASYSIARKYLTMGQMPPANAVRLEEFVNYFPYRDPAPEGADPFAVRVEMAACPWQPANRLVRIGLKAKPILNDQRPPSNLVFLIDVSGSMNEPNKLPLVKASLMMLLGQLGENDRVAIVVYAGASGLVLDSTSATKKAEIIGALDRLQAGGSTNGGGGLMQAYDVAVANFNKNGTNRVILCTDGDWNVGTTSTPELIKLVEEKRKTGVFLSVLGYGMGNLRDEMMVQLAGKGNGNYAYIDTAREANKALVEQLGGTLVTVAKDVKIQIEFNPAAVKAYRLLGYEKRILAAKDFHDDKKDAGEMGAGHVVTALYELVPADGTVPVPNAEKVDPLRYQVKPADPAPVGPKVKADEAFVLKMRHKKPDGDVSTLRELPVKNESKGYDQASEDFRFAAAVASFAMLLRESPYKGNATFAAVQELADAARAHDPSGYRAEFSDLVKRAKALSGKP